MSAPRPLDLICLGRAAVDLYGEQIGSPLESMQSLAMYLGGSAGNIAVGSARQELRVAMLTRLGHEPMGRFVRQTLIDEGVDVAQVQMDDARLTGLVLLGIRDRDTFPLVFYRENCADMALAADDIDPDFIASATALLVTGTHFSTPGVDAASRRAMQLARAAGTRVVLDIDYRPVLWGLTGHCGGESRFVASDRVTEHLQSIVPSCDLVVGTEEEFHIAGGSTDTLAAVRAVRAVSAATLVVKRGPLGCVIFAGAIPDAVEQGLVVQGLPVEVLNVLGAGDAFMSGFLRGWLADEPLADCARYANACGALVVSRHGCAPAMPTRVELDDYLVRAAEIPRIDQDPQLNHLHRVTTRRGDWPELCVLAFDHRVQLEALAREQGAPLERLAALKQHLAAAALQGAGQVGLARGGLIVDARYGEQVLRDWAERGWWLARPIERAGHTPLSFAGGPEVGLSLRRWPRHQVVKCLVQLHSAMDVGLRARQEASLQQLFEACTGTGHELLIELVHGGGERYQGDDLARCLARLYALGVAPDWWKLPALADAAAWQAVDEVIAHEDRHCRGVLLLGGGEDEEALARALEDARACRRVRGFAVGRTIFHAPAAAWLAGEIDAGELERRVAEGYARVIGLWRRSGAVESEAR